MWHKLIFVITFQLLFSMVLWHTSLCLHHHWQSSGPLLILSKDKITSNENVKDDCVISTNRGSVWRVFISYSCWNSCSHGWFLCVSTSASSRCENSCSQSSRLGPLCANFCVRMVVLRGVISQILSSADPCVVVKMVVTAMVAVVVVWTVRLLVHHAWYTHRLSCFNKPPTHSWLIGHLGQVRCIFHLIFYFFYLSMLRKWRNSI